MEQLENDLCCEVEKRLQSKLVLIPGIFSSNKDFFLKL